MSSMDGLFDDKKGMTDSEYIHYVSILENYLGESTDDELVRIIAYREHSTEYFDIMPVIGVGAVVPKDVMKGYIVDIMPVDEGYDVIRVRV